MSDNKETRIYKTPARILESNRRWQSENRERKLAYDREYRRLHKEEISERRKIRYQEKKLERQELEVN